MSWYKYSKDYADSILKEIQRQESGAFTNSGQNANPNFELDIDGANLENALNTEREDIIPNPNNLNEARMPVRTKATGQGGDALLNANKDLPIYGDDNFTRMTGWNTQ